MQFDIENFYPWVSNELLVKTLLYAKTLENIKDEEINTITRSKKYMLFNSAELCELVGLYILQI